MKIISQRSHEQSDEVDKDQGSTLQPEQASRFLRIPWEIRDMIYRYLLDARHLDQPEHGGGSFFRKPRSRHEIRARPPKKGRKAGTRCAIFCVNKRVYEESIRIFFTANLFIRLTIQHDFAFYEGPLTQTPDSGIVCGGTGSISSQVTQNAIDLVVLFRHPRPPKSTSQLIAPAIYLPQIIEDIGEAAEFCAPYDVKTLIYARFWPKYESMELEQVRNMLVSYGDGSGRHQPRVMSIDCKDQDKRVPRSRVLEEQDDDRRNSYFDDNDGAKNDELDSFQFNAQAWLANLEFQMEIGRQYEPSTSYDDNICVLLRRILQAITDAGDGLEEQKLREQPLSVQTRVNELRLEACLQYMHLSAEERRYADEDLVFTRQVSGLAEEIVEGRRWSCAWETSTALPSPRQTPQVT